MTAALRSNRGAANRLLAAGLQRRYFLLISVPLMLEYKTVLTRPEYLDAAGLTREEAGVLLDAVAAMDEPVGLHFSWRPQVATPTTTWCWKRRRTGVPMEAPPSTCAILPDPQGGSGFSPSDPAPAYGAGSPRRGASRWISSSVARSRRSFPPRARPSSSASAPPGPTSLGPWTSWRGPGDTIRPCPATRSSQPLTANRRRPTHPVPPRPGTPPTPASRARRNPIPPTPGAAAAAHRPRRAATGIVWR